ncbi:kinase-like domain-containing protein [Pelagophyceae sp. CCMP2097]|nr:kinase-like domain-containing protein [Pelagophyceae sp. CCMP2097]
MALSAWLRGSSPGPRRCVIPVALTDWKDPDSFYAAFVTGATLRGASSAKVDPRAADGETECTARSLPIIAAAHVRRDDAVAAADAAAASGGAADGAAECAASCSRLSPSEVESIAAVAAHCEIPAGDVELRGELGHGSFGVVRAASWRHTPVAVKVLFDHVSPHDRALFRNEVSIMASIQHPNIVQFLGYARLPELALVMEIFPRGSIQDYMIFDKPPSRIRLRFCVDMARGLEYLHQRQPGIIIHRDIKPQNYFLTEALTCKLGQSRLWHQLEHSATRAGA